MSDTTTAKAFLADDHWTVIKGLEGVLEHHGIEIVGSATTADEVVAHCSEGVSPNEVIVLDLSLDDSGGRETYTRIKATCPNAKVLVLSMRESISTIRAMYRLGIDGYITKSAPPGETAKAVQTVAGGGSYFQEGVAERLLSEERRPEEADPNQVLTEREMQIFKCLAREYTTEEIAEAMGTTAKNVTNRLGRIRQKLGDRPYTEFGWLARKYGIVELDL